MKKTIDFKDNRGVMSLIVILGIGLFVLAIALTLTGQIVVEIMRGRNTISGDLSFHTAEAAAREGLYQHVKYGFEGADNFPLLMNDISTSSISFEVTTSSLSSFHRDIKGDAQNANYRRIEVSFLLDPVLPTFDYAVYSNKELTFNGNAISINDGKVFSNNKMTCNGLTLNEGVAFSSDTTSECDSSLVEEISPPVFDPYYFESVARECPSSGDNPCFSSPPPGFIIVRNSIDQNNLNIILDGNLIVIGAFEIGGSSNVNISSSENYPALFVDGDLTIKGASQLFVIGIVYVTGKINIAGTATVNVTGSIISAGELNEDTVSGNITIIYNPLSGLPVGIINMSEPVIVWSEK